MLIELPSRGCRHVAGGRAIDELGRPKLLEPSVEHGRRDRLAARLELAEGGGPGLADRPEHAHRPAASQEVERSRACAQVADDFACPNGLAFSLEERSLYIADSGNNRILLLAGDY